MGDNFGVRLLGIFLSLLFIIMYSFKGFFKLLGIGLNDCLYLVLLLGLLLNSYLGLGELIAKPCDLGVSFALVWKAVAYVSLIFRPNRHSSHAGVYRRRSGVTPSYAVLV